MITLVLGGEGYLNFMGNEFGHPGKAQALYCCTCICARSLNVRRTVLTRRQYTMIVL